jgi:hypothetical protein
MFFTQFPTLSSVNREGKDIGMGAEPDFRQLRGETPLSYPET